MEAFEQKHYTPNELLSSNISNCNCSSRLSKSSSSRSTNTVSNRRKTQCTKIRGSYSQNLENIIENINNRIPELELNNVRISTVVIPKDFMWIMLTMLFVISIVLTGNTALAAQRDSFKTKDPHAVNSNANAIFNEITGNTASQSGDNNINTVKTTNSLSTSTTTAAAASSANAGKGSGYTATTSTQTSVHTNTISGGGSASSSSSSGSSRNNSSSSSSAFSTHASIESRSLHKSSSSGINRNTIEFPDLSQNGPYFDKAASKNITALLGKTAYLNCRVKNLGNKTMLLQVSWVRHRDIHLLTVGRYTYTSDQRFRAIHQPQTEDWILQIKYPQHRDSGIYECQVSSTPHMSHYIHLNVVEPSTEIIGAPDLYIESGSTINLTCVILNSPEPPTYIFWNHNNAIINYDSPRGGVSVVTNKGETTTSFLLIKSARPSDSGHYQCNPSNAKPKSVTVHVLNGVSHSVSRGIPSSNAARGTSTPTNVSKSLYLSVPVNVLVYLSICQAIHKAASCAWDSSIFSASNTAETLTVTCFMDLISLLAMLLITMANLMFEYKHNTSRTTTTTTTTTAAVIRIRSPDINRRTSTMTTTTTTTTILQSAVKLDKNNKWHDAYMQLREHCNIKDTNLCSNMRNTAPTRSSCKSSNSTCLSLTTNSIAAERIKLLTSISSRESILNNLKNIYYKLSSSAPQSQQVYHLLRLLLLRLPRRQYALHQKSIYFTESDIR